LAQKPRRRSAFLQGNGLLARSGRRLSLAREKIVSMVDAAGLILPGMSLAVGGTTLAVVGLCVRGRTLLVYPAMAGAATSSRLSFR
jgi:hypothetical protein